MAKTTKKQAEKPQDLITDLELMALETQKSALSLLRRKLKDAEERLKGQEQDLIGRLDRGALVVGSLGAEVRTEDGQCRPEWKEVYLQHMATHGTSRETAEQQVRAQTDIPKKRVLLVTTRT